MNDNKFGLSRASRFAEIAKKARIETEKQCPRKTDTNNSGCHVNNNLNVIHENLKSVSIKETNGMTSLCMSKYQTSQSDKFSTIPNKSANQAIKAWRSTGSKKDATEENNNEQPAKMVKVVTTAKTVNKASKSLQSLALRKRLKQQMLKIAEERLNVRQIFRRYVEQSTLHGFRYTCSDTYFIRRFIWAILMTLGAVYFIVKLKEGVMEYLDYPFSTLSTVEYVDQLQFPAISFCTINQFRYSKLKQGPLYKLYLQDRLPLSKNWSDPGFDISGKDLIQEIDRTSFQIEDIFKECDYIRRDTDHPNREPQVCSSKNFTKWFSESGQICFTLNSGQYGHRLLEIDHEGLKNGFEIMFDLEQYDVLHTSVVGGLQVIIHDQNESPVANTGFMVSTGFKTFISLQREETKNLPPPYATECGTKKLNYFNTYNQKLCLLEKLTDYVGKVCGCREPFMPDNGMPLCSLRQKIVCVFPTKESFDDYEMRQDCPIDCEIVAYTKRVSEARFVHNPPKGIEKLILQKEFQRKNVTSHLLMLNEKLNKTELDDYIEQNIIVVIFYFGEMSKLIHEQGASFDFYQFLGDMGGEIGLMLGASLLTFVEFVDLLIFLAYHQLLRLYKQKKEIYRQSVIMQQERTSVYQNGCVRNSYLNSENNFILKNTDALLQ